MNKIFTTEEEILESLEKGREFCLSAESNTRIKAELSAYADLHSIPTAKAIRSRDISIATLFFARSRTYALAMILILISASAGTSFASEKTLPGDFLYPVKIRVTEPVRTALIVSVKEKASWEAELAARRLQEATELAALNKLDSQTGTFLTEEFTARVNSSLAGANTLQTSGDTEASADVRSGLEARVTAHASILALIAEHTDAAPSSEAGSETSAVQSIATEASAVQATITKERIALEVEEVGTVTEPTRVSPEEVFQAVVALTSTQTTSVVGAAAKKPSEASAVANQGGDEEGTLPTQENAERNMLSEDLSGTTQVVPEVPPSELQVKERINTSTTTCMKKNRVEHSTVRETAEKITRTPNKREQERATEIAGILEKNKALIESFASKVPILK